MHFCFDILVNLDETLWQFYEWDKSDNIIFLKKVPLLKINEKIFKLIYSYNGIIDSEFIKKYYNKTIIKGSRNNATMFLLTTGKNCLVIEVNKLGNIISRSQLMVEDEINCNEKVVNLKDMHIPFKKTSKLILRKDFRQGENEKRIIKTELKTIKKENNLLKCSYLYYEWFGILENNLEKMIDNCLEELEKPYSLKMHHITNLIKLSYKECL